MMTSRSEYRLILRQDNADLRLTPLGREIGLVGDDRWNRFCAKKQAVEAEIQRLERVTIPLSEGLNAMLVSRETSPVTAGIKAAELLRRPQIGYRDIAPFDPSAPVLPKEVWEQAEIEMKYAGYIKKQLAQVEQMKKLESRRLPEGIDYRKVAGLRLEAQEKLNRVKPLNIGQASRISGVSPADISVLMIWMEQQRKQNALRKKGDSEQNGD